VGLIPVSAFKSSVDIPISFVEAALFGYLLTLQRGSYASAGSQAGPGEGKDSGSVSVGPDAYLHICCLDTVPDFQFLESSLLMLSAEVLFP